MLPPDRGHLATEQRHAQSMNLDALDVDACIALMIHDHTAVLDALRSAQTAIAAFVDALAPRVRSGGRLIYLGAGTSGRLGVLDASECPPTFNADPDMIVGIIAGGDDALRRSSEMMEDDPDGVIAEFDRIGLTPRDTVLGIAAGGTTPYVLGGIAHSHARGARTGLLTCSPEASPKGVDHLIIVPTGPELLTGSTRLKAGTATKIALNIITTTLFVQLGKTFGNLMVDLRATNDKLTDRALRILREIDPSLTREQAFDALQRADGRLKLAILMHKRGLSREEATATLHEHHGRLRGALDG